MIFADLSVMEVVLSPLSCCCIEVTFGVIVIWRDTPSKLDLDMNVQPEICISSFTELGATWKVVPALVKVAALSYAVYFISI